MTTPFQLTPDTDFVTFTLILMFINFPNFIATRGKVFYKNMYYVVYWYLILYFCFKVYL